MPCLGGDSVSPLYTEKSETDAAGCGCHGSRRAAMPSPASVCAT